ncbi:MAG: TraR/DksA C4-type zinc finger protein [Filomicrobium sp.]
MTDPIDTGHFRARLIARRDEELVRIDAALQRIEDGSYGECLVCEELIALKRLEFDPAIATCVSCAAQRGG